MFKKFERDIKKIVILIMTMLYLSSSSQCLQVEASQKDKGIPNIKGKLLYHTYLDYNNKDSKMYIFDFETKENICINDKLEGVYNTINGHFSNSGSDIVFMGMVDNDGTEEWDIFQYNLETNKLDNLTKGNNLRDEDPKYSPDGMKIIFKQGHWSHELGEMIYDLKEMDLGTRQIKTITNDVYENSMPYYLSDGKSVCYAQGVGESSQIYNVSLENTNTVKKIWGQDGVCSYYPIVYKNTLYFSKWYSKNNKSDIIVKLDINTNEITMPFFNSKDYDCSDPFLISDRFIIFSSTMPGGHGGYDLYIADVFESHVWSLDAFSDSINNDENQLGASCYIDNAI